MEHLRGGRTEVRRFRPDRDEGQVGMMPAEEATS